jgi:outer membrane lipoprotein-sorting protein
MKTRRKGVLFFAFIGCVGGMRLAAPARLCAAETVAVETADSILRKMLKAYGDASSYKDEGVTLTHDPAKPGPDQIVFTTLFKRPNSFRFDWTREHPHPPLRHLKTYSVIWSDGKGVYTYRQPPATSSGTTLPSGATTLREEKSMGSAIAGATGVSRASSHHVLRLLSPDVGGFALTQLESVTLVGTAEFEGLACFSLTGRHPRGGTIRFWVGKSDFLIRRIIRTNGASGNEQEEIRRNVQVNVSISDDRFDPTLSIKEK